MRRTLMPCLLLILAASAASAGDIYIPANTPGTGGRNNWPFNPTYGPEWRYQLVFTATQLGNKPLNIADIAFATSGTGTLTMQDLEVRMSHSQTPASSTFANNLPNPQVVLLAKNYLWNTTDKAWTPLGLTAPFNYNGVDYLTIEIRYRNGVKSGFSGTCYYDSGSHPRIYSHNSSAYNATSGSMDNNGLKIRITTNDTVLILSGSPNPGGTVDLDVSAAADAGKPYQVASSLGLGPVPLGNRQLDLTPDVLMDVTVNGYLPAIFKGYSGVLDTQGKARGQIVIPGIPALKGIRIHTAFLTLDAAAPLGISQISPTASFTIL